MDNWLHIFLAGLLAGIGLMLLGAILAHAYIYGL
jgi:hypothetical protein